MHRPTMVLASYVVKSKSGLGVIWHGWSVDKHGMNRLTFDLYQEDLLGNFMSFLVKLIKQA